MAHIRKKGSVSIDLMKTARSDDKFEEAGDDEEGAGTDEDGDDEFERKERDLFENAGRKERSLISTWKEAGKKDKVIQTLISKFAMLVHKNDTDEIEEYLQKHYDGATIADYCADDVPHDALYSKLPSAVKALIKLIA